MFHVRRCIGACLEDRVVFEIWRLEHCGYTNASLEVVTIVLSVCNA